MQINLTQNNLIFKKKKKKRSDSVLWQKSLHQHSEMQGNSINTPPKTLINQRLQTDLGRSVGVTPATKLV